VRRTHASPPGSPGHPAQVSITRAPGITLGPERGELDAHFPLLGITTSGTSLILPIVQLRSDSTLTLEKLPIILRKTPNNYTLRLEGAYRQRHYVCLHGLRRNLDPALNVSAGDKGFPSQHRECARLKTDDGRFLRIKTHLSSSNTK
jgi:hypothetical protein